MAYLSMKTGAQYGAIVLALVTLTGCPNSIFNSSSSQVFAGLQLGGRLVDGYVQNATVVLDLNDDRICSDTEPTTLTDASGNFVFTATQNSNGGQHMTCASGGIDLSTGLPLVGQLMAPPGATQITPLSSVIMAQINSTLPVPVLGVPSAADTAAVDSAATSISASLGLTASEILTVDPMTSSNPALLQATVAVQTLAQQTTTIVSATTGAPTSQSNSTFNNSMASIASALAAATSTPVSLSSTLTGITNSVVSSTVVKTQVSLAAAAAANPADTALQAASVQAQTLAPASVAAFVETSVSNLVAIVATSTILATATGATNPANQAQSSVEIANAANLLSALLTTDVANTNSGTTTFLADLSTLGDAVTNVLSASTGGTAVADATTINTAIATATTTITVPLTTVVPVVDAVMVTSATSLQEVVPISSVVISGSTATSTNGVLTVSTGAAGITSATLNLGLAMPTTLAMPSTVDIGFRVTSDVRKFKIAIKGLTVTPNVANPGAFTLTVPATATLTAYGLKAAGNSVNATVSQAVILGAIGSTASASGSAITINVASLLTALGNANSGFSTLTSKKGVYTVTAVMSGIPLAVSPLVRAANDTIAIENTAIAVSGSSQTVTVTVN